MRVDIVIMPGSAVRISGVSSRIRGVSSTTTPGAVTAPQQVTARGHTRLRQHVPGLVQYMAARYRVGEPPHQTERTVPCAKGGFPPRVVDIPLGVVPDQQVAQLVSVVVGDTAPQFGA